jgi:hypothetical protein
VKDAPLRPEARRLLLALDLMEAGFEMTRQRLRRLHPEAGPAEIERRFTDWLRAPGDPIPGLRPRRPESSTESP